MPCYTPLKAYRAEGGRVVVTPGDGWMPLGRPLKLRCGQCLGCRAEKAKEWALRCVHEAQLHSRNCFITLTYSPEEVPWDGSLDVRHWQLFAKRLRERKGSFRFLHCGEYGDHNFRPHYHACVFGLDFSEDRVLLKRSGDRELFTSRSLEETWGKGFCTVGHLTYESAAYVARYVMKKAAPPSSDNPAVLEDQVAAFTERYRRLDFDTGEEWYVKPEYVTMSRRPGLGAEWFDKYQRDVYPSDEVVHDGRRHRPPRFYDDRFEAEKPQEMETVKARRRERVCSSDEYSPERLRVRERCAEARLRLLKRDV